MTTEIRLPAAIKACALLETNRSLTIWVNRQRSLLQLPISQQIFVVSKELRDKCLESVTEKVAEFCEYFFADENGTFHYLNQAALDELTKGIQDKGSSLKFSAFFGLIDKETNIELMSEDIIPSGWATMKDEKLSLSLEVSGIVIKIISKEAPDSKE